MISCDTPIGTKVSHPDFGIGVITEMYTTTAEIDCGGNPFYGRHEHLTIIGGDMKEFLEKEIQELEEEVKTAADDINTTTRKYDRLRGRLDQAEATLAHLLAAS